MQNKINETIKNFSEECQNYCTELLSLETEENKFELFWNFNTERHEQCGLNWFGFASLPILIHLLEKGLFIKYNSIFIAELLEIADYIFNFYSKEITKEEECLYTLIVFRNEDLRKVQYYTDEVIRWNSVSSGYISKIRLEISILRKTIKSKLHVFQKQTQNNNEEVKDYALKILYHSSRILTTHNLDYVEISNWRKKKISADISKGIDEDQLKLF